MPYNKRVKQTKGKNQLDLKEMIITPETDKALIPLIRAYHGDERIPSRQELLDVQYEMPVTTGHCNLKGLALQAGFNADDYIKEIRQAEKMMARALEE